jgi:ferredoxin
MKRKTVTRENISIVTPHKTFKLSGDESLLDGLLRTGHQIEYQCRHGYCGACRCKLVSGEVSYPTLPLAFIPAGEVLTCCGKPESTLVLDLPAVENMTAPHEEKSPCAQNN